VSAQPAGDVLFEHAACGLVLTDTAGIIVRANATACAWLGYAEDELAGKLRMLDLLPVGARLFHHTHCQPILRAQGSLAEIQLELVGRDGQRLPMLLSVVRRPGPPESDEWALFLATQRRSYERELLLARRAAEEALEARKDAESRLMALNAELSAADRRLNEAFENAVASGADRRSLRREQDRWLATREGAAGDPAAVRDAYNRRIQELESLQPAPGGEEQQEEE